MMHDEVNITWTITTFSQDERSSHLSHCCYYYSQTRTINVRLYSSFYTCTRMLQIYKKTELLFLLPYLLLTFTCAHCIACYAGTFIKMNTYKHFSHLFLRSSNPLRSKTLFFNFTISHHHHHHHRRSTLCFGCRAPPSSDIKILYA